MSDNWKFILMEAKKHNGFKLEHKVLYGSTIRKLITEFNLSDMSKEEKTKEKVLLNILHNYEKNFESSVYNNDVNTAIYIYNSMYDVYAEIKKIREND